MKLGTSKKKPDPEIPIDWVFPKLGYPLNHSILIMSRGKHWNTPVDAVKEVYNSTSSGQIIIIH